MRIAGSTALVTGASSGIGAATARRLAAGGALVLASGRDAARLAFPDVPPPGRVLPLVADLSGPGAAQRLAADAFDRAGRLDILVNNAGLGWAGPFVDTPVPTIDELIAVNLTAPLLLTRAVLPRMRPPAALVFVGSIAGRLGVRHEAAYAAVKAGLDVFAGSLRQELSGTGISVSTIVPGVVDTPFFQRRGAPYRRSSPRPVPADRVAGAVVRAIGSGRAESYVPAWLRLPVAIRATLPGAYRAMARRMG